MRRLLAGLLVALLPSLALGQAATIANGACRLDGVDCGVTASGVATAGTIAVWGSGPALGSFDWLTATDATKTVALPKGTLEAGLIKSTALSTPGSITVTPVYSKVASITTVAGSALVDGDYLTVEYAPGLTVPIEFDLSPGDGTTGGRVPLLFTAGDSADLIRDNIILILNGAVPAQLTASSGGAATVSIVLDTPGAVGGTLTENVTDGGFAVTGFANPTAATTVTYRLVAKLADGTATEAGAASSTAASTATLSAANFLRLTWSAVTGAASYDIYRTVAPTSPATTGKIIASTAALTLDDTGLAGDSGTAPTTGSTGRLVSTALTSGRVALVGTGGQIQDDAGLTYSGTGTGTVFRIGSAGTGLSEISAGVLGVGTGAAGSVAGEVQASKYWLGAYANIFPRSSGMAIGYIDSEQFRFVGSYPNTYSYLEIHGSSYGQIFFRNGLDAAITAPAANTIQLGDVTSGTPAAQTLTVQGATGTNVAGQDWTVTGSLGTGTAASGKIVFKVGTPTATGSTQHTPNTVLTLQDTGTGGTAAPQVLLLDGTVAKPVLGIAGHPNSGINFSGYATQVIYNGAVITEFFGSEIYVYVPILAKVKIAPNTGTATPTAADSQTFYTNTGDGDGSTVTLPAAAAGLQYTIYVDAAQTVTVTAVGDDTIRIGASVTAAAGSITNSTPGSSVTLTGISATQWVATSTVGTAWTF